MGKLLIQTISLNAACTPRACLALETIPRHSCQIELSFNDGAFCIERFVNRLY